MRPALLLIPLAACVLASQDVPRSEYPQPQFQRDEWLTLNGRWEFEFDDANVGLKEDWPAGAKKFSRAITVPFAFESAKSGIGDPSFHPYIWYRRAFTVPAAWRGKRVLLNFGAVDYLARVWVNGRAAGEHRGGNVPFRFDITPLLKAGANTIVVRAEDQPRDLYMPRGKQFWKPKSASIFYTRTSGIWQPVWIEAAGESYLERVRITPSNDGLVRFEAKIDSPAPDLEFHATVARGSGTVASAMSRGVEDRFETAALVSDPALWSPADPALYDVTFELRRAGAVIDRVHSYFGFRTVAVERGRVAINGRPVYLKFVLDQGYWPESTLTPPSEDAIQYDIRMTKEMGFNGVRKHQKVEDPRYLYWADKLGLLVSGEIANAYRYDETYVSRITGEWIEAVERDYNHPSVIMWVPINESWGVPDLKDPRQQFHLKSLYALTHSLDATRPVIDNDGWEHTEATDLLGLHDYAKTGDILYEKYRNAGEPGAAIPDNGRAAFAPGVEYNGAPLFLSEFGGIAFIPEGANVPKDSWGYAGVEKTREAALARLRSLYEGIARTPFIGICYTQLTDVEQEVNGLMTYDRKLKFDAKALREINALLE
ncbi:MAG: glycoside hydrolase family 2 protein [Acidobacteriota bacterium]